MSEFEFRLRFHFSQGYRINHDAEELVVFEDEMGRRLRLKFAEFGIPIKQQSRVALIGGSYQSEGEAYEAAMAAKRALLIWAVTHQVGVDLGDGKVRGGFTTFGQQLFEAQRGRPARNDVHGIDVYPRQAGLVFTSLLKAKGVVRESSQAFIETVANHVRNPLPLTEKQAVACELYCSSFFDTSFRSRLITLVSAVEALLDPPDRSPAARALVAHFKQVVRNANLDAATKNAMTSSLQWLCRDSIGQTGRALSDRLLPDHKYLGQTASHFFNLCYELRSQIVHQGSPRDPQIDLLEVANTCQQYVADLLLASFKMPAS